MDYRSRSCISGLDHVTAFSRQGPHHLDHLIAYPSRSRQSIPVDILGLEERMLCF
ncbi:hypothetical protein LIA77_05224 [Sarocladium implicatum]|nr:hypothetical protein LIA77_05224 [Sarocladium implicatum]